MSAPDNSVNRSLAGNAGAITVRKQSKNYDAADVMCFVIPAAQFIRVSMVGVLSGADFLLLLLFLYLLLRKKIRITIREGRTFLVLCSLWLAEQILTDIVRHSAFADLMRGWSNIGLTIVNFCALFPMMYRNRRRLELFGWGMVAGRILATVFNPDVMMAGDPWKFGYSFSVTWAIFLLASRKGFGGRLVVPLSIFAAFLNIFLGARSMGGICLAVAVYFFMTRRTHKPNGNTSHLKIASKIAIVFSLLAASAGISWLYSYAAESGRLGEDARSKYEDQSGGKYGLLLGGRTESLAYVPAIYDSPILGHGSWAKDPLYIEIQLRALALLGYTSYDESVSLDDVREGLIPTHSHLFGAWVEAGILGAVFWTWIFILLIKLLFQTHSPATPLLPLISFVTFQLIWDIFFSPYRGSERIVDAYYLILIMSCIKPKAPKRLRLPVLRPIVRTMRTSSNPVQ